MTRFTIAATVAVLGPALSGAPRTQNDATKNVVEGVVISYTDSGPESQPIANAIAIAYTDESTPISVSEPTQADGHFKLIVPQAINNFKLAVHDKGVRYWEYKPVDFIANKTDPHEMGKIPLTNKHDLSASEIRIQVEGA